MTDFTPLDAPIWSALTGPHNSLARRHGLAARYPGDVSPFAALQAPTPQAFVDLGNLVGAEEGVALVTAARPEVPGNWQVLHDRAIEQMVCAELPVSLGAGQSDVPDTMLGAGAGKISQSDVPDNMLSRARLVLLGPSDVPDMLALTAATEPGPFAARTIAMGKYIGLRSDDGRLMAMAGQRLSLAGFTEISAVCCYPEFRGKGYPRALIVMLMREIFAAGKIPFLHVKNENGAKFLYEKIGFKTRREMQLTVIAAG